MRKILKKKTGVKSKRPSYKEFEKMYIKENLTAEQMARLYDVKVGTIYNWAHQFRKEEENA